MADPRPRVSPGLVLAVLIAPFLLWAAAEVIVLVWMVQVIGWWTLAVVGGTAILGFVLLGRQGRRSLGRLRQAAASGLQLEKELGDAGMVVSGAVLLILPGVLGNLIGLSLVLPPTRPLVRGLWRALARWAATRKQARTAAASTVIAGDVVEEDMSADLADPAVLEGPVLDAADDHPRRETG